MSAKQCSERHSRLIVRGEPSDDELAAALIAVLTAASQPADLPTARSAWTNRAHALRLPLRPSADSWRFSARP